MRVVAHPSMPLDNDTEHYNFIYRRNTCTDVLALNTLRTKPPDQLIRRRGKSNGLITSINTLNPWPVEQDARQASVSLGDETCRTCTCSHRQWGSLPHSQSPYIEHCDAASLPRILHASSTGPVWQWKVKKMLTDNYYVLPHLTYIVFFFPSLSLFFFWHSM